MDENKKIPGFKSYDEMAEFWDTHDLADYWKKTKKADITFNLKKRHYYVGVLPKIAKELQKVSEEQVISKETVVNLWLQEKIQVT